MAVNRAGPNDFSVTARRLGLVGAANGCKLDDGSHALRYI
jgi:hypothetical protein